MNNFNCEDANANGSLPTAAESTEQPIAGLDAARTFGELAAALKGLPSSKLLEYRLAITPAPTMSEERPMLCETPQTDEEKRNKEHLTEAYLKALTQEVERFEELREVITDRIFFEGTKQERLKLEHRYELLQYLLFGSDDYCVPGTAEKELEELRSDVMELGTDHHELSDEVKELLRRIDVVAEEFSDE